MSNMLQIASRYGLVELLLWIWTMIVMPGLSALFAKKYEHRALGKKEDFQAKGAIPFVLGVVLISIFFVIPWLPERAIYPGAPEQPRPSPGPMVTRATCCPPLPKITNTPTPTNTPTATPTRTNTPTSTATPTLTPSFTTTPRPVACGPEPSLPVSWCEHRKQEISVPPDLFEAPTHRQTLRIEGTAWHQEFSKYRLCFFPPSMSGCYDLKDGTEDVINGLILEWQFGTTVTVHDGGWYILQLEVIRKEIRDQPYGRAYPGRCHVRVCLPSP